MFVWIASVFFFVRHNEADLISKVASDVTAVLGFTPSKDFDDFVWHRSSYHGDKLLVEPTIRRS